MAGHVREIVVCSCVCCFALPSSIRLEHPTRLPSPRAQAAVRADGSSFFESLAQDQLSAAPRQPQRDWSELSERGSQPAVDWNQSQGAFGLDSSTPALYSQRSAQVSHRLSSLRNPVFSTPALTAAAAAASAGGDHMSTPMPQLQQMTPQMSRWQTFASAEEERTDGQTISRAERISLKRAAAVKLEQEAGEM